MSVRLVASFALATAIPALANAQTVRSNVPVVTRLVQEYSGYEVRLSQAIGQKDKAEIDKLVADNFEMRTPGHTGDPVPRAAWLAQSIKNPAPFVSISDMAVHDLDPVRIVSFTLTSSSDKRRGQNYMIVDVWSQKDGHPILVVRYAAASNTASAFVPGEAEQPVINKKY